MRAVKLHHCKGVGIWPIMQSCVNWGGPTVMVPCLYQGNIYIKRKLWVWRDQKCIILVGAKIPLTCAGCQTTLSQGTQYRAENTNLHKLWWTYRHGTVLHQGNIYFKKEATGMERPEMYFSSQCKNPSYLCVMSNYPSQRSWYRPENGN